MRVSTDYNDGSHSPEASLTPGEDGHVKASFGYKSQSDSISVIAEGFESQLLVVKDVPEAITLKSRVKDVLKLKVGNTPEVKDSGEVIFTVSAIDSSAIKKSDYTISAYEVGSLKKLSVSVTDNDEKSFNVVCTDSGGSHVLKTGILLNISENSSSAIVLMNTWLSSKQIGDKATNTIHAIGSVDVKSGGAIEAKDSASTGMTGIEVVLPSGGIDTSGLNESCGSSAKAFLEVNVYKLSETASSDVIARTKGSFSSLAEISLDITDCSGPVDPNAGALKELLITIPYDSSQVSVEDIENGVYRVYHSSNLSDFETLDNLILVPVSDIKLIDPVAGTITFTVNHLSVFGVGASSSLTSGASSDNNSGCTIGRTSDSSLVVILMLAVFVAIIRSRSKIKTDQGLK